MKKNLIIHLGVICLLFLLQDIFSLYHQGNFARILVLAVYGIGYKVSGEWKDGGEFELKDAYGTGSLAGMDFK